MKETFGQRLTRLRKELGLTQGIIAQRLGISVQAVSKWENDLAIPDIAILPELADILGVSTDVLLGHDDPGIQYEKAEKEIDTSDLIAKVRVYSAEGDCVKINLPLDAISMLSKMAAINGKGDMGDVINKIDLDNVVAMAKKGILGDLVNIHSSDGDSVQIYVGHYGDNEEKDSPRDFFRARAGKRSPASGFSTPQVIDMTAKEDSEKKPTEEKDPTEVLSDRINEIVAEMAKPGADIDALSKELTETSKKLANIGPTMEKVDDLEEEKEDLKEKIDEAVESLKEGDGDPMKLSFSIANWQKQIREIDDEIKALLGQKEGTDADSNP